MTYDGCNFDLNVRRCCVISQMGEELNSVPAWIVHPAQLHLIFYRLGVSKGAGPVGKVKVNCSKLIKNQMLPMGCDYIFNFSD